MQPPRDGHVTRYGLKIIPESVFKNFIWCVKLISYIFNTIFQAIQLRIPYNHHIAFRDL